MEVFFTPQAIAVGLFLLGHLLTAVTVGVKLHSSVTQMRTDLDKIAAALESLKIEMVEIKILTNRIEVNREDIRELKRELSIIKERQVDILLLRDRVDQLIS